MKYNKEKIILSILILFQTLFLCYLIFNNNENISTLNNSYNNYKNNDIKESTKNENIRISDQLPNTEIANETTNEEIPSQNNISKEEDIVEATDNQITESNSSRILSLNSYIKEVSTLDYSIKSGDTISKILREFENTCNYKTGFKYLKLLNPNINLDEVEINTIIKIPYDTFYSGKLYSIKTGDTWYKLIKENYPEYNVDSFSEFLIDINDLPNSDLPLGEKIFLPKI